MQLSRNRIIGTAIELIERHGVAAFSMPGLAAELGCGVVPLYVRIPSKAALLDRVAAVVMSEIELSAGLGPEAGWKDRIFAEARAFREVGREHPRCTVLAAGRPRGSGAPQAPGERAAGALTDAGFDRADSARIASAIRAYVLGSLVRDACLAPGAPVGEDFEFGLDLLLRAAGQMLPARR